MSDLPPLLAAAGSAEEMGLDNQPARTSRHRPLLTQPLYPFINLVIFQLVWVVTVFGVNQNRALPGLAILCFLCIVHGIISTTVRSDVILAAIAVTLGLVIDTVFIQAGLLSFEMNLPWPGIAPFWILILWVNFALILNHGLRWMQGRYKIAAILGFIGGPLSYLGGIRLGAGELHVAPLTAFLIIGACWAIVTPLLLTAARELIRRTMKS